MASGHDVFATVHGVDAAGQTVARVSIGQDWISQDPVPRGLSVSNWFGPPELDTAVVAELQRPIPGLDAPKWRSGDLAASGQIAAVELRIRVHVPYCTGVYGDIVCVDGAPIAIDIASAGRTLRVSWLADLDIERMCDYFDVSRTPRSTLYVDYPDTWRRLLRIARALWERFGLDMLTLGHCATHRVPGTPSADPDAFATARAIFA